MQLLDNELARRFDGSRLVLRTEPLRVRWSIDDLTAADGHRVRCAFACSVRAIDDPSERRMLAESLLGAKSIAYDSDVSAHFAPALRDAAVRVASERNGIDLVADAGRQLLTDALKAAAKPVAFACGVEALPPFDLQVESPTLQEQRLRSMQRAIAEQHAAGQLEHVQRAGELLKQFQAIRQTAPDLSAGHILQQINPSDRGALLQTLLLASAKGAKQDLWAVAGPSLMRLDFPADGPVRHELINLPTTLGPLRSVQPADVDGRQVLLVGARSGFFVIDREKPSSEPQAYSDPDVTSQLGFSRVVSLGPGREFCACHGEAGIVWWNVGEKTRPSRAVRLRDLPVPYPTEPTTGSASSRVTGPRNLQPLADGSIVYSVGNRMVITAADGASRVAPPQSPAEVIGIVPAESSLIVIHEDGTVCAADCKSLDEMSAQRRPGRIRAVAPLPWLGGMRVLLASEEGPVYCVGLDDDLVTQYVSPHRDLRVVTASAERVVGVSADRQRLIVWNAWDGRKPAAEIYVAGIARHRVADVEFA
jgi:hypothetical protein